MDIKTIVVKGNPMQKEAAASGAITPGHLLERTSTANTVKVHATAGGKRELLFAIEDALQGKEIGDAYSDAARVQFVAARPGDEINALIYDDETIAIGDWLESAGNGTLRKFVAGVIVAVALAACDMSGSAGEDPSGRCLVEAA